MEARSDDGMIELEIRFPACALAHFYFRDTLKFEDLKINFFEAFNCGTTTMFIQSRYVLCRKIAESSLIENSCFFPTYLGSVFRSCCRWLLIKNSVAPVNQTCSVDGEIRNERR